MQKFDSATNEVSRSNEVLARAIEYDLLQNNYSFCISQCCNLNYIDCNSFWSRMWLCSVAVVCLFAACIAATTRLRLGVHLYLGMALEFAAHVPPHLCARRDAAALATRSYCVVLVLALQLQGRPRLLRTHPQAPTRAVRLPEAVEGNRRRPHLTPPARQSEVARRASNRLVFRAAAANSQYAPMITSWFDRRVLLILSQ